jgi:tetratricopeptide (TPR) repeat protein
LRNTQRLGAELTTVLQEIDRDFDDMSRQKLRSDLLEKRFDQLGVALGRYEKVFRLYGQVTGNNKSLRSFQAKALRIDGARHTTRADLLWDRLEYTQALEEYSSAITKLQEAIPLARLVEDQKLIGSCLNNIGYASISKGDEAAGLRHYSEALKLAEHRQDDIYRGLYNLNMGVFFLSTGKPQESLRYSLAATALTQKTGRKTWEANTLLNVGSAHLALGHKDEAQDYLQKALDKSTEANDRRSRGRVLFNLALLAAVSGRHTEAAPRMEEALKWYADNEDVYSHAELTVLQYQGLGLLATTYERMAEPEKVKASEDRLTALRNKEGTRLAAYLADPHLDFSKWPEFKATR